MKWQAVEMLRSIMQYSQYPSCKQVSRYHKTSSRFKRLFWMQFLCPSWNLCPKTCCQQGLHDGLHLGCHNTQHFQLNSIELIKAAPETTHTSDCREKKQQLDSCSCFCLYFFPLHMWWPGTIFSNQNSVENLWQCVTLILQLHGIEDCN